jgi:hypothetical protein
MSAIKDKNGKQIGVLKDGYALDLNGKRLFKQDGVNLLDLVSGKIVCHLTPDGLANTPGNEAAGNASHHFEAKK